VSQAVEVGPSEASEEHPGALALQQLLLVARLVSLHAVENEAVQRSLPPLVDLLGKARAREPQFTATFAPKVVWINGRLLRASRSAYQLCEEVGALLKRMGANQLVVHQGFAAGDLSTLLRGLGDAYRGKEVAHQSPGHGRVALSKVQVKDPSQELRPISSAERAVDWYTSAVVIARRAMEEMGGGGHDLFRHIKRLAQRLVVQAEGGTESLRRIIFARGTRQESEARVVHTAILALLAARRITRTRRVLLQLASAAMTMDAAKPRAAGQTGTPAIDRAELQLRLSPDTRPSLPQATAYLFLSVGHQMPESLSRASVLREVYLLQQSSKRPATPISAEAELILAARRVVDEVAAAALEHPVTFPEAVARVKSKLSTPSERSAMDLVASGLALSEQERTLSE
jgi:hypothetical protein